MKNNVIHHSNSLKQLHDHINLCRKSIWHKPTFTHYKDCQQTTNTKNILNLIKGIHKSTTANILLKSQRLDVFSQRLRIRQRLIISILIQSPHQCNKANKRHTEGKRSATMPICNDMICLSRKFHTIINQKKKAFRGISWQSNG